MKPLRRDWTDDEEQFVADWYPHVPTQLLAYALRCDLKRVYCKANELGLHKTFEAMAEMIRRSRPASCTWPGCRPAAGSLTLTGARHDAALVPDSPTAPDGASTRRTTT